ncbi:transposase [Colletotrichum musicola]|uniref:Transposase n=1 Tax=Colletotrichum musicola TaxID=2175873 RepID=A0A8H6MNF8_9PEZI|nr:transposase [Colletotrichum musicola]
MQEYVLESRIILAMEAKRTNPGLSLRRLTSQFDVPRSTLQYRITGRTARSDKTNGSPTLTPGEEEAIVQYILDLDSRGFSPQRCNVEDIANLLTAKYNSRRIGKN